MPVERRRAFLYPAYSSVILMGDKSKRPVWFVVSRHWLSLLGLALLATALISSLFVVPKQIHGHFHNPYLGIIVLVVLPIITVDIAHHISWKGSWNYYQYGEKSFVGPTDPRYFNANNATFSLLWSF